MTDQPPSRQGRLYTGTSGFAYPNWAPLFYPPGTTGPRLLAVYAERLNTVELNNTFYQQPRPDRIAAWLAATPPDFRFVVKAQRGGSLRALGRAAVDTVEWLTAPYRLFGERLGSVLFRVAENIQRDVTGLSLLLAAWPVDMPLTLEFQHPSWHDDEVYGMLAAAGATLCATDLDDRDQPDVRLTGRFVYLRLRRMSYTHDQLTAWAERLAAFIEDGIDCYVFMRHDESGAAALRALELRRIMG